MTHFVYCPGPLHSGCPDKALVPNGICPACESKKGELEQQRRKEGDRLRAIGFSLLAEIDGVAYWQHHKSSATFSHAEALAYLGKRARR
jgi:hypothetical protein